MVLKNYETQMEQFISNFNNLEEESLRIMKSVDYINEGVTKVDPFFFNTFLNNFTSIFVSQLQ